MNIRQTDLLEYIVNKFNTNSFNIPFRMGTVGLAEDTNGLVIYAPTRDNQGEFDRIHTFDEETYQTGEKTFVVMSGNIDSGEYVALPNIKMATYSATLEFLVYIDNPVSEIIRMAIEEIRDQFIGNMDIIEITEVDFDIQTQLNDDVLKVVTTADGLDFGQVIEIKGKKYLNYSFTVTMNVSKNVDFGNQIQWALYKNESSPVEPTLDANLYDVDDIVTLENGTVWKVLAESWVNIGTAPGPVMDNCVACPPTEAPTENADEYCKCGDVDYYWTKTWEFVEYTYSNFIPLIWSWGTNQDIEPFQNLRPFALSGETFKRAMEVHNYVRSRGFGTTFTFLLDTQDYTIRDLFKQTFLALSHPPVYNLKMTMLELEYDEEEETYLFVESEDLTFERKVVYGEAQIGETSYGEPIVFSIGFVTSAKDV